MNKIMAIGVGAVLLLLLLIFSTTYTVSFHEVAIRRTFGKSDKESVQTEPGLKWKLPIIQAAQKHDRRIQILESTTDEVSTVDAQQIVVKGFLLWRIEETGDGALAFDGAYDSVGDANVGLRGQFETALQGVISSYRLQELLGRDNKLPEAERKILERLSDLQAKGITPVAVGISQLLLPERTSNSVIRRMEATRAKLAEAKRFQGSALAQGIDSDARTKADKIKNFAEVRAEQIRAQANEKSAVYLEQMSEEEGLATFLVWLDALETSLNESSTFILPTDFAPWHLMRVAQQPDADGIPRASPDARTRRPAASGEESGEDADLLVGGGDDGKASSNRENE